MLRSVIMGRESVSTLSEATINIIDKKMSPLDKWKEYVTKYGIQKDMKQDEFNQSNRNHQNKREILE